MKMRAIGGSWVGRELRFGVMRLVLRAVAGWLYIHLPQDDEDAW